LSFILNKQEFINLQDTKKLSMTEMANLIGVSRSQLWRILRGSCNPGEQFLAGFKKAFPKENFDNFFLIDMVQQSDTKNKSKTQAS